MEHKTGFLSLEIVLAVYFKCPQVEVNQHYCKCYNKGINHVKLLTNNSFITGNVPFLTIEIKLLFSVKKYFL